MPIFENPFPGMNPYLEAPNLWQGVHTRLIAAIDSELSVALPDDYITRIEERVYIEGWDKFYKPDNAVLLTSTHDARGPARGTALLERESVTAALPFDAPLMLEWTPRLVRERFVAIRTNSPEEALIAVIEILSPTNKTAGIGRDEYQNKHDQIFGSTAHLLEIDLLRMGQRFLPPDDDLRGTLPVCDYLISLHEAGQGNKAALWPASLRSRLPRLRLPLADDADFVALDIQTVVNRAYSEGGLARNLLRAYLLPPLPPLGAENEAWADALLRERGLRP